MQTVTISFDATTESGKQVQDAHQFLISTRDRIEALMRSEFGVDIEDEAAINKFVSPLMKRASELMDSITAEDVAAAKNEMDNPAITPVFVEGHRVGHTAKGALSAAYFLTDAAVFSLKGGSVLECVKILASAHEFLGRAKQAIYERKFLSLTAKHKANMRHKGNHSAKAEAHRLAREKAPPSGQWQSRLSAARAIRSDVKEFAVSIGKPLPGTDESILKTIYMQWLPEMPDADTLFASTRTTLTRRRTT